MKRAFIVSSLICGALAFGCGDDKGPGNDATPMTTPMTPGGEDTTAGAEETGVVDPTTGGGSGTTEVDPSAETGNPVTTTTPPPDTTTTMPPATDPGGTTMCDFICTPDTPGGDCDVFAQDCPDGEKCSAYADDGGGSWNNAKCVPVMENPQQPGDPCLVEGNGVSGIDNCDLGSYCWDTDAENMGVCVALCKGTPESFFCEDSDKVCAIYNDGVLNLCLASCDPLQQDCDPTDVCIGNPSGDGFLCVLDASGEEGQQHDPCEFANSCDPGLICLNSTAATECDPAASGCCEPFCDLADPNPDVNCTGMGQKCEPYFEMGMAPPGSENIGICAIPM